MAISAPIYSILCFKDTEALGAHIALTQHTKTTGIPASEGPGCCRGRDFILFPALTQLRDSTSMNTHSPSCNPQWPPSPQGTGLDLQVRCSPSPRWEFTSPKEDDHVRHQSIAWKREPGFSHWLAHIPVTSAGLLSQEAQTPPNLRPGGRSIHQSEPTQDSTALLSAVQGRQYTHHAASQPRQWGATPSKHFSLPDSCPSCRKTDPGHPPSMEQKPGLHDKTSEGKHSIVVIEDAALLFPVCIHSSKEQARVAAGHGWQEEMQTQHYRS